MMCAMSVQLEIEEDRLSVLQTTTDVGERKSIYNSIYNMFFIEITNSVFISYIDKYPNEYAISFIVARAIHTKSHTNTMYENFASKLCSFISIGLLRLS